jgi:hypothetical protein
VLKKSSVFGLLLFAAAFSLPVFADNYSIDVDYLGSPPFPVETFLKYDPGTGFSAFKTGWQFDPGNDISAVFDLNASADNPTLSFSPTCAGGATGAAATINCLVSESASTPTFDLQWLAYFYTEGPNPTSIGDPTSYGATLQLQSIDSEGTLTISTTAQAACNPDCPFDGVTSSSFYMGSWTDVAYDLTPPTPPPSAAPEPVGYGVTAVLLALLALLRKRVQSMISSLGELEALGPTD